MLKRKYKNINGYYTYNLITVIIAFIFSFLALFSKFIISFTFEDKNKNGVVIYNSFGKYLIGNYQTASIDDIFNTNLELLKILSISLTTILIIFTLIFFANNSIKKPFLRFKNLNNIYVFLTIIILIAIVIIKARLLSQFILIEKSLNSHILIEEVPNYVSANIDLALFLGVTIVALIITLSAILFNISILKLLNSTIKSDSTKTVTN